MKKIISAILALTLVFFFASNSGALNVLADAKNDNAKQFIGYGYNITSGKAICDPDALNLNSPILDLSNSKLQNAIKVFNASKITYESNTSKSVSEISEMIGEKQSGSHSLNANVNGLFGPFLKASVDIDGKFNDSKNETWTKTVSEEYSYYTIHAANTPVILQLDKQDIMNCLSQSFLDDLKKVKSDKTAEKFINKYGTHLLTGYTLGGIFELTNYYATDSSSYIRQQETNFSGQVNTAISVMNKAGGGAGGKFSFTENYGNKDNNQHAVNNYKCTTYGGKVFPGLTIDQAFSWYETLTEAGYMYKIWTDSINDGTNLVIVDIPKSSEMIPIWNLIPNSSEYRATEVRQYIMNSYLQLSENSLNAHNDKYRDIFNSSLPQNNDEIDSTFIENGYQYLAKAENNEYISSYISKKDNNESAKISAGSIVAMDYDEGEYKGKKLHWTFGNNDEYFDWSAPDCPLDSKTGIFRVKPEMANKNIKNLLLQAKLEDGTVVFEKSFDIVRNSFSGGDGSENNPFIIANVDDFKLLTNNSNYYNNNYHFKLITDLDLSKETNLKQIGTFTKPFNGVFDGNYNTISGFRLTSSQILKNNVKELYLGLFGYNEGLIKNLTIANSADIKAEARPTVFDSEGNYDETKYEECNVIGLLVANNSSRGIIRDCVITGGKVHLGDAASDKKIENSTLFAGVFAGRNEGIIEHCKAENCEVSAKFISSDYTKFYHSAYLGVFAGINANSTSDNSIYECSNISSTASSKINPSTQDTTDLVSVAGGICGLLKMGIIKNCITVAINANSYNDIKDFDGGRIYACAISSDEGSYACAGGIAGEMNADGRVVGCFVKGCNTMKAATAVIDPNIVSVQYGLIAGSDRSLNDPAAIPGAIENCIVEKSVLTGSTEEIGYVGKKTNEEFSDSIKPSNNLTLDEITHLIDENDWEVVSLPSFASPLPIVDSVEYTFYDSSVKKNFLVGEGFKVQDIQIKALHKNGNIDYANEYYINFSQFNSTTPGAYHIYIRINGYEHSYDAVVREANIIRLQLTVKNNKTYYEGDAFDPNDLIIECIKENGEKEVITNYEAIHTQNGSNDLSTVVGLNTIAINYNGLRIDYNYLGMEKEVKSIEVKLQDNGASLPSLTGLIGEKNIDTSKVFVKINYSDPELSSSNLINYNNLEDCGLIIPEFVLGKNEVVVSYKDLKTARFDVVAEYKVDNNIKQDFINKVNLISDQSPLYEQYIQIMDAKKALLGLGEYSDEETKLAETKLQEAIDRYNSNVNEINTDFEESIDIASTINYSILYYTGFIVFSVIIILLKSLI